MSHPLPIASIRHCLLARAFGQREIDNEVHTTRAIFVSRFSACSQRVRWGLGCSAGSCAGPCGPAQGPLDPALRRVLHSAEHPRVGTGPSFCFNPSCVEACDGLATSFIVRLRRHWRAPPRLRLWAHFPLLHLSIILYCIKYLDASVSTWKLILDCWFARSSLGRAAILSSIQAKVLTKSMRGNIALPPFWSQALGALHELPLTQTSLSRDGALSQPIWDNRHFTPLPRSPHACVADGNPFKSP
eukprot:scaffold21698_cov122-Isochrysis_galbana.AAC.1